MSSTQNKKTEPAPEWRKSPLCFECDTEFTLTNRQHHCRNCGHSFCNSHSSHSVSLPHFGFFEPVRVCDACHHQLLEDNRDLRRAISGKDISSLDWQDDKSSDVCMRCSYKFTLIKRRHHCRFCGHIVCGDCSRYKLSDSTGEEQRACDQCVETKNAGDIDPRVEDEPQLKKLEELTDNTADLLSLEFLDEDREEGYQSLESKDELELYNSAHTHFQFGYAKPRTLRKAFAHFRIAAVKGHPGALFYTGMCYELGKGTTIDFDKAVKCYVAGMQRANMESQFHAAFMYSRGYGVPKDTAKAKRLYRGCFNAFRNGAEQGRSTYQFFLARCYLNGNGTEKDATLAIKWYMAAADNGYVEAQYFLGNLFQKGGESVPKNLENAEKFYTMAAERNHAGAINILHSCFSR